MLAGLKGALIIENQEPKPRSLKKIPKILIKNLENPTGFRGPKMHLGP